MTKILTLILFLSFSLLTYGYESCIPENDLYISANTKSVLSIDEKEFNEAIDNIENIYAPIFEKEFKAKLVVERKWDDGTVNAYAFRKGSDWHVAMFGGLARHKEITQDGFMAVVCHEIGHHIGGAPKKKSFFSTWASNEGQADYFATSKCMKLYFEKDLDKTLEIYRAKSEGEEQLLAKSKCDEVFKSEAEAAMCYRGALAGKSLARLLGSLRGNADVKYSTPDTKVVSRTDDNHPAAQCRLDTYFNGTLCDKDSHERPDQNDAAVSFCMRADGYKIGTRPLCWYKP